MVRSPRESYALLFEKYVLDPPVEAAIVSRRGRPPKGSEDPSLIVISRNLRRMGRKREASVVLKRGGVMTVTEFVALCGDDCQAALAGASSASLIARDLLS